MQHSNHVITKKKKVVYFFNDNLLYNIFNS